MTRPDAATEALADVLDRIAPWIRADDATFMPADTARVVAVMLRNRGYVIRKARKSG